MNDFLLNDVVVRPRRNELCIDGRSEKLPAKFIDVLMVLAERQGEVFGKPELLKRVWNDPLVGEESVANAVWMLRKTLGDDARRPAYIETVPRRGYRLVARVLPAPAPASTPEEPTPAFPEPAATPIGEAAPVEASPEPMPTPTAAPAVVAAPAASEARVAAQRARIGRLWPLGLFAALLLIAAAVRLWQAAPAGGQDVVPLPFRGSGELDVFARDADGALYVGGRDGTLFAFDGVGGGERWRLPAAARLQGPAFADATLLVAAADGRLYALDRRDGREHWRREIARGLVTTPLAVGEQVLVGDSEGSVHALDLATAIPRWRTALGDMPHGHAVTAASLALFRTTGGRVHALALADGRQVWAHAFPGLLRELVVDDDQLLLASDAGFVAALAIADGSLRWQTELVAAATTPLLVGRRVVVLGRRGDLVAFDRHDGTVVWQRQLEIAGALDPVWWNGCIAVVLRGGALGLIDAEDGSLVTRIDWPEQPQSLLVDGQRLLVATASGRLFALSPMLAERRGDWRLSSDGQLQPAVAVSVVLGEIERLADAASVPKLQWQKAVVGEVRGLAMGTDGSVFLADERAAQAFAADGTTRWFKPLPPSRATEPAYDAERVYLGRRDGSVRAFDRARGTSRWTVQTGGPVMSPPVVADGRVFVGSDDRHLYALDAASGAQLWRVRCERPVRGRVAVVGDRVVFGAADRVVRALDVASGRLLWQHRARDWVVAYPVVADGRVFIGVGNGDFLALGLDDGRLLWRFETQGKVWFAAAADDARVYFASGDGHLYALDQASGREQWRYRAGAAAEGSVLLRQGQVIAGSRDFHLYALDAASGQPQWRLRTRGPVFNPAAHGDWLAVTSADQQLYALRW